MPGADHEDARESRPAASRRRREFPARLAAFADVAAFLEEACGAAGVGDDERLRLTLMVEELFTNTVLHGHGGDCDEPVELSLEVDGAGVVLTYEDTAPAHDPFAAIRTPDESSDAGQRPVGGLGILLISRMAARFGHAYVDGRNRITLVVPATR